MGELKFAAHVTVPKAMLTCLLFNLSMLVHLSCQLPEQPTVPDATLSVIPTPTTTTTSPLDDDPTMTRILSNTRTLSQNISNIGNGIGSPELQSGPSSELSDNDGQFNSLKGVRSADASSQDEMVGSTRKVADSRQPACTRTVAKCVLPLHSQGNSDDDVAAEQWPLTANLQCFGTDLGYSMTSFALANLTKYWQVQQKLREWEVLRQVPACWKVIQPLLCGIYLPKCENSTVRLVSSDLCRAAMAPCRVMAKLEPAAWQQLLDCQAPQFTECRNNERAERIRFNTTAECPPPLVLTGQATAFHPDIDRCGMRCESPLLTDSEYSRIKIFTGIAGTVCLLSCMFSVTTFLLDWSGSSRFPALSIFYINLCYLVATLGWLAQLTPDSKERIVCRDDGTLRDREPGSGENLSCVVVFVLIYYFTMAAGVWLVILSYTWSAFFNKSSQIREKLGSHTAYFHMLAWLLPLILTIITMAINRIEASSVYGICYVGFRNVYTRVLLTLLPFGFFTILSGYFSGRSLLFLASVSRNPGFLSKKEIGKVQSTIFRIGFFSVGTTILILVTFACHVYEFLMESLWDASLNSHVICLLKKQLRQPPDFYSTQDDCSIDERPSLTVIELQILCMFGGGILSASWLWTKETLATWKLFFVRVISKEKPERPVKWKKHQLIAQAYAKRHELQANGRLSLVVQSTHEDPLGLHLNMNDVDTSGDFSSGFAAALPHLVQRRGGLCGAEQLGLAGYNSQNPTSYIDTSIDNSVCSGATSTHGSFMSMRSIRNFWRSSAPQQDTSVSRVGSIDDGDNQAQISDIDRLQSLYEETLRNKGKQRRSKSQFFRNHAVKNPRRRRQLSIRSNNSSISRNPSDASSLNSQILPAVTLDPARLLENRGQHSNKAYHVSTVVPPPGQSTDFGAGGGAGAAAATSAAGHLACPVLEEKLQQLTDTSGSFAVKQDLGVFPNQEAVPIAKPRHLTSIGIQTSPVVITGTRRKTRNAGTQVTPPSATRRGKHKAQHPTLRKSDDTTQSSQDSSAPLNAQPKPRLLPASTTTESSSQPSTLSSDRHVETENGNSLSSTASSGRPLQHIEANVVPTTTGKGQPTEELSVGNKPATTIASSDDSSTTVPSSFEKDFRLKKLPPHVSAAARGKENLLDGSAAPGADASSSSAYLDLGEIEIPALKPLIKSTCQPIMRPRDRHSRGRRGAIVEDLSSPLEAAEGTATTATSS